MSVLLYLCVFLCIPLFCYLCISCCVGDNMAWGLLRGHFCVHLLTLSVPLSRKVSVLAFYWYWLFSTGNIREQTSETTLLWKAIFWCQGDSLVYILVPYLMRLQILEGFSRFWIELPLTIADENGRSDECVVRLTIEDILAHLWLLSGQQDAWYYRPVNLENWVCASLCNFGTVLVQVDVFIIVCVAEKLGYNCCFFGVLFSTAASVLYSVCDLNNFFL